MTRTVAVGIGGAGARPALAWAGAQALSDSARLVLLHACPPYSPLARTPGTPPPAQLDAVDPPLARAVRSARAELGDREVSLRILEGDPGIALPEAAAGADLLVIGAGRGGSTVRRVIRRAHGTVIVAHLAHDGCDAPFPGQVVVGVDAGPAGHAALEFAIGYAQQHGLTVTAVRVTGADRSAANVARAGGLPTAMELLHAEVDPWKQKYPSVRVRGTVLHGDVAEGLIWAGTGAHLLVVGNRHRGLLGRARTGDVPLAVAHRARGPVAVVPVHRREGGLP